MYDRNIRFSVKLSDTQKEILDKYVKNTMSIKEEYDIVQDLPIPYIFIRVKGKPNKINTELTPDQLNNLTLY